MTTPDGTAEMDRSLLHIALSAAVPLRIAQYAGHGADGRAALASNLSCGQQLIDGPCPCAGIADIIACHGDAIIRGDTGAAQAFNALARGLALGAYLPGGVNFAGTHWQVKEDRGDD